MHFSKSPLALAITAATLSAALLAPQAQAASKSQQAEERKTDALEAKMEAMAAQMAAMQAELSRVKGQANETAASTAKVQELDHWMASVKSAPEAAAVKDNLVAVRGGFANLDHARGTGSTNTLQNGDILSNNNNNQGFYFGGAFDFNINNDLYGLMDDTSFAVELGFQYDQYGAANNALTQGGLVGTTSTGTSPVEGGTVNSTPNADGIKQPYKSTDSRLRLNASPKIKFMHGSKFRPWIIPVGMEINILGVPSNAVSVLNSGMQFGAGAEYDIFKGIVVGTDARYHYSTSKLDGTPTDGFTTGGYVGFKF